MARRVIDNLNEINRLLAAVHTLSHGDKGAPKSSVERFCRDIVLEGRFPNHQETINFSIDIGIVTGSGNRLQLTKLGKKLLELNPQLRYELNENQKEILVKNCLLAGKMALQITEFLKQFVPAYSKKTYQWSAVDNPPLSGDLRTVELMRQSGLLKSTDGTLFVDQKYVSLVRSLLTPPYVITPSELALRLKEADVIGRIAEDIVLNFERQRLQSEGCLVESECIQKISELNIAAGYDIRSFDGHNPDLVHDRFIEVKGSTGTQVNFYWTKIEIEQAKILGPRYWVYFVGGIDKKSKKSEIRPILIKDPAKNVLKSSDFEVECEQFFIRRKV